MAVHPEYAGNRNWLDLPLLPPGLLIAARMKIPVMQRAERHRELVRNLPAHGAGLGKAEVMRLGG